MHDVCECVHVCLHMVDLPVSLCACVYVFVCGRVGFGKHDSTFPVPVPPLVSGELLLFGGGSSAHLDSMIVCVCVCAFVCHCSESDVRLRSSVVKTTVVSNSYTIPTTHTHASITLSNTTHPALS